MPGGHGLFPADYAAIVAAAGQSESYRGSEPIVESTSSALLAH
jgi:hypothetical protein